MVRSSLHSLNPWDSPFRQEGSEKEGRMGHHVKQVSYLSTEQEVCET